MSIKTCAKCGVPFTCSNEQMGCWCENLYLDMKTLKLLKETYNNCLCPNCLNTFTSEIPRK